MRFSKLIENSRKPHIMRSANFGGYWTSYSTWNKGDSDNTTWLLNLQASKFAHWLNEQAKLRKARGETK